MSIVKKCPICNSDAMLQDAKTVPTEGAYSHIYRCKKGHVYRVKTYFKGIKRTVVEVLEGEENGPVQNGE